MEMKKNRELQEMYSEKNVVEGWAGHAMSQNYIIRMILEQNSVGR